jgi:hypothetical protein
VVFVMAAVLSVLAALASLLRGGRDAPAASPGAPPAVAQSHSPTQQGTPHA